MSNPAPQTALTVIIPAFNAAATIARAVRSAIGQPGIAAVLVIDDGSTDNTADLAAAAGATVLRQANAGPAAARNLGLDRAANPTHALFLDADDELLQGGTEAITDVLDEVPDATGVIGAHIQTGGTREKLRAPEPDWVAMATLSGPGDALGPFHVFCTTGFTLTRRAIDAGVRFDPDLHFAEDRDLIYRAAQLGDSIAVIGETLVRKFDEPGRMTASPARTQRWLRDQTTLTLKHIEGANRATRVHLADSLTWVFKHALRSGTPSTDPIVLQAATMLRQLGRSAPTSRSARFLAPLRALLNRR